MSHPPGLPIPIYDIFRNPGERERFIAVKHSEDLLPQKKIWLSPHRKNYYLLMIITKGSGRQWIDMVPYEFKAGSIFFTTPEHIHVKEDVKATGTVICIGKEFFAMTQNSDLLKLPFLQNIQLGNELKPLLSDKKEINRIVEHIVKEYQQSADLQDEMLYAYMRILLLYLGLIYNKQYAGIELGQYHEIYARFQACIELNYKTIHDVKSYADKLNISVSYLNALIKEYSGASVMTHLHNRKLLEAKRLLYNTNLSVKEIAFELGYHDTSYFNRFFKKLTSVTPLEYRADISE